MGIFRKSRNTKERERIVDLARALENVGPPEGEPGVVTFADLEGWIDLPTEEALAAERADRRRDTLEPRSW